MQLINEYILKESYEVKLGKLGLKGRIKIKIAQCIHVIFINWDGVSLGIMHKPVYSK